MGVLSRPHLKIKIIYVIIFAVLSAVIFGRAVLFAEDIGREEAVAAAITVPSGLSDSEYRKLLNKKLSLDEMRANLLSDIAKFNADCGRVSSKDKEKIENCRLRYQLLEGRKSRYNEEVNSYAAEIQKAIQFASSDPMVVDLRDAGSQTVNMDVVNGGFTKARQEKGLKIKEPPTPEAQHLAWIMAERQKAIKLKEWQAKDEWAKKVREAVFKAEQEDPETRIISPALLDEIKKTFDQDKLELEACMTDPMVQEATKRSMAFDKERRSIESEYFSTLDTVKKDLKPQYPGLPDQALDLKAIEDPRMKAVAKKSMEFEKTAPEKEKVLNNQFYSTLKKAKEDLADKKAEEVLRDKWRKEAQEKEKGANQ